jgi:hypothetical protein
VVDAKIGGYMRFCEAALLRRKFEPILSRHDDTARSAVHSPANYDDRRGMDSGRVRRGAARRIRSNPRGIFCCSCARRMAPPSSGERALLMRISWTRSAIVFVLLVTISLPLRASNNEGTSFVELFSRLIHLYDRGALEARKIYVTERLIKLNRQLWKYEQDKQYLIMSMQRTKPAWEDIDDAAADLRDRIPQLLDALEPIASELRSYDTAVDPADEVRAILVLKRNDWLERVSDIARRKAASELPKAASEGAEVLRALKEADKTLAHLISKLQA